jgi:chloramphenicol O-acetyltransferase
VQAHHGFVDGYHIHLLAEQIAAEITDTMGSGTMVSGS